MTYENGRIQVISLAPLQPVHVEPEQSEPVVESATQEWVDELNDRYQDASTVFSVEYNKKYARIVRTSYGQRSVYAFVKIEDGSIWKAAGWKAPAKNFARGNVFNNRQYPQYGF